MYLPADGGQLLRAISRCRGCCCSRRRTARIASRPRTFCDVTRYPTRLWSVVYLLCMCVCACRRRWFLVWNYCPARSVALLYHGLLTCSPPLSLWYVIKRAEFAFSPILEIVCKKCAIFELSPIRNPKIFY